MTWNAGSKRLGMYAPIGERTNVQDSTLAPHRMEGTSMTPYNAVLGAAYRPVANGLVN